MSPKAGALAGRAAIVTGASSGIGQAVALRLAREGASVLAVARRAERLASLADAIAQEGGRCAALAGDVGDHALAERAVAAALELGGGRLDMLVNAAGLFQVAALEQLTDEAVQRTIEVDLLGPMRLCRAAAPPLRAARGVIVNISSINSIIGDPDSPAAHYNAAKAGLDGVTRQLAVELAPEVRAISIAPGVIDTPMISGWAAEDARQRWLDANVPLRRLGRAEEIAGVVSFCVSDDASYVTGCTILADGGYTVL
jgi:NAD(P)-dependent dehydrogenase (short-subunit alcohol dehydrogenase family)